MVDKAKAPPRPRAVARIHIATAIARLEELSQGIEKRTGSAEVARKSIEKILLDIEFLRENNRAGRAVPGLDERYRRWNVNDDFYIVYWIERLQEEILILDIRSSEAERLSLRPL